jgi:inositol-pentakisphosphate 2-kinase
MAPSTTEKKEIPVLPLKTGISYLSEGAANIVYRISVPYSTPPPSEIDDYGDGTPPPTEIEEHEYLGRGADMNVFDSKLARND